MTDRPSSPRFFGALSGQPSPPGSFRAHDLVVEPALNRIRSGSEERAVEPRAMEVLACLARHAGHVVSKDALLDEVWGGIAISPNVLTYSVATARKALGDDWREPRFIETISKGGYRWIAPAEPLVPEELSASAAGGSSISSRWPLFAVAALAAVAALSLGYLAGASSDRDAPSMLQALPLTSLVGWETHPAISPDGRQVAFKYQSEGEPQADIHLQVIGSASSTRFTSTEEVTESAPAWSPDASHLAYVAHSAATCQILRLPAVGGIPDRLADCVQGPLGNLDWSPDGTLIAYDDREAPARPRSIRLLDIDSGMSRLLTQPAVTDSGDRRPVFSPDGSAIVFQRIRGGGLADLYRVPVDGGEPKRLTFDNRDIGGHDWTADGQEILFSSYRAGQFTLWRVAANGGEPRAVAINDHQIGALQVADASDRLVYSKLEYSTSIWSVRVSLGAQGTSRRAAVDLGDEPIPLIESTRWDLHPSIAPNTKRVAFVSDRSGHFELWSADAQGAALIRHTSFEGPFLGTPRWSPDSASLVFDARPDGNADLYRVDSRGSHPERFTDHPADDFGASYSQDGAWIYFTSYREDGWEVWRMPSAGGPAERVTDDGAYAAQEGPDGRDLYYTRYGQAGLWRLDLASGSSRQILEHPVIADWGNWVVANGGLYVLQRQPQAIVFYDPELDESYPIVPNGAPVPYNHPALSVSDDGTWFLVGIRTGSRADLMVVDGLR